MQQKIARLAMGIKKVLPDDVIELKRRDHDTCDSYKGQFGNLRSTTSNVIVITFSSIVLTSKFVLNA